LKYWEIIANNLSAAGWTWGVVSAVNTDGKTVFVADAHRNDGKRFIVRADELLTAFAELECHAKQIDEFNFVNITYPLQQIERQEAAKLSLKRR
jgi:hypothetical protein